jgi:hypothetical protein
MIEEQESRVLGGEGILRNQGKGNLPKSEERQIFTLGIERRFQ